VNQDGFLPPSAGRGSYAWITVLCVVLTFIAAFSIEPVQARWTQYQENKAKNAEEEESMKLESPHEAAVKRDNKGEKDVKKGAKSDEKAKKRLREFWGGVRERKKKSKPPPETVQPPKPSSDKDLEKGPDMNVTDANS
jgi:hypothetical protein